MDNIVLEKYKSPCKSIRIGEYKYYFLIKYSQTKKGVVKKYKITKIKSKIKDNTKLVDIKTLFTSE